MSALKPDCRVSCHAMLLILCGVMPQGFGTFCKVGAGPCSGGWDVKPRAEIEGNDLDCNAKDFKVRHCQWVTQCLAHGMGLKFQLLPF